MTQITTLQFSFHGRLESYYKEDFEHIKIAEELNSVSSEIENEIAIYLMETIKLHSTVKIRFSHGSLIWEGLIDIVYSGMEVLSTLGGVAGLIQLIRESITRAVERRVNRLYPPRPRRAYPRTRVILLTNLPIVGQHSQPKVSRFKELAFGIAAIIIAIAALIASVSLIYPS